MTGLFLKDEATPTGTCAVLVTPDGERTLIANLSAANNYKLASPAPRPPQPTGGALLTLAEQGAAPFSPVWLGSCRHDQSTPRVRLPAPANRLASQARGSE